MQRTRTSKREPHLELHRRNIDTHLFEAIVAIMGRVRTKVSSRRIDFAANLHVC